MARGYGYWVLVILMLAIGGSGLYREQILPPLIRLHVVAHSDKQEDQALKLAVRDQCIRSVKEILQDSQSLAESRQKVLLNLDVVEQEAQKTVRQAGYPYSVEALYGRFQFPTKIYGGLSLPAGEYEAVRLVIGQGQGANWWCVLFPPLCFVEGRQEPVDGQEDMLQEIESGLNKGEIIKVRPAFKVVELWQEMGGKVWPR